MATIVSKPDFKYLTWYNVGDLTWATSNLSDGSPITWSSRAGNTIEISISELVFANDKMSYKGKDWEIDFNDNIRVNESFNRRIDFNISKRERIKFSDLTSYRQVDKPLSDSAIVTDGILSNSRAVISDFVIGDTGIPDISVPVGYSKWKQFIPGQYTYQKALFKCKLMPLSILSTPILKDFIIYIDVEDIIDRAFHSKVSSSGNTWISFNKDFHIPPDISFLMAAAEDGSNTLTPEIKSVTRYGFNVVLLNKSGQRENGEITWLAIGY